MLIVKNVREAKLKEREELEIRIGIECSVESLMCEVIGELSKE